MITGRGQNDGSGDFVAELERVSREIRDPVAKLRFIRSSLGRYRRFERWIQAIPWRPLRRVLFRWLGLELFQHVLVDNPFGSPSAAVTVRRRLLVSRLAAAAILVGSIGAGVYGVRTAVRPDATSPVLASADTLRTLPSPPPARQETAAPRAAEAVPDSRGVMPAAIWQVEQGSGFEQYSNGLRIETGLAVAGTPRLFHVFSPDGRMGEPVTTPVGILFHTSESDVWPLDASFNERLRDSSHRLLKYVQKNKLYHYVIDRFGRVYRIVDEASKANHAGHSVWQDEDRVYLNLNHAFLGVSFETRWEGGRALPITQAQFAAGRNLTDHLRQKYGIAAQTCTAHGLTSVNPRKRLIGHHVDWARGFPFAAYGLPDQYAVPPPSVTLFGFGYDVDFVAAVGDPWPGVQAAGRALADEAGRRGITIERLREEKGALFDQWLAAQAERDAGALVARTGPSGRSPAREDRHGR